MRCCCAASASSLEPKHMSPLRVLVCGTNYGRLYLESIALGGASSYRLVGIFARGSPRSQQMALAFGVPLYCRVEDLPAGIDLACAAMGASGCAVIHSLLARGIHVLCEHPQKPDFLRSAFDAAASRNLCFHVNGHFADLAAARAFISYCHKKCSVGLPSFVHVTATDRSLYATLDILRRALPSFAGFRLQATSRLAQFILVQGLIADVPATFQIQRGTARGALPDGSPSYLVDHRIEAGFASGILTLLSMNGPVVWNANLNFGNGTQEPLFAIVQEDRTLSADLLAERRVSANLGAIEAIAKDIREGVKPVEQEPNSLLEVSHAWKILGGLL